MRTRLLSTASFLRVTLPLFAALALLPGCRRSADHTTSCCDTNETTGTASAQSDGAVTVDPLSSDWNEPADRPALNLMHTLTRHDGVSVTLKELASQPLAVSFAYTRCMNPNKCRLVTTTMSALRKRVQEAGLLEKVKLVLITYDVEYDAPKIMRDYAERNGLELDEHTVFLRPSADPRHRLFQDLKVNASFNVEGVTMHGIQLLLVDKAGRLARTYRTLIWDNDQVTKDIARLAAE